MPDEEMLRTFNMSIGLTAVIKSENVSKVEEHLNKFNINTYQIGKIKKGTKQVLFNNNLAW